KRDVTLQRTEANPASATDVPASVHEVLRSPGQLLDSTTRAFFEPRFGRDFSHVRVHTDARAAESAQAVNALDYTVGRQVVFGAGQFLPGTAAGRQLLAHELTHIIQQGSATTHGIPATLRITVPVDAAEVEAETVANTMIREQSSARKHDEPLEV